MSCRSAENGVLQLNVWQDDEAFEPVRLQLKNQITPRLLTLQHYVDSCRQIVLSWANGSDDEFYENIHQEERRIVQVYDPKQLLEAHKLWLFICWLSSQILNRPSYVSAV